MKNKDQDKHRTSKYGKGFAKESLKAEGKRLKKQLADTSHKFYFYMDYNKTLR